jgi:hypothetical protein
MSPLSLRLVSPQLWEGKVCRGEKNARKIRCCGIQTVRGGCEDVAGYHLLCPVDGVKEGAAIERAGEPEVGVHVRDCDLPFLTGEEMERWAGWRARAWRS